MIQAWTQVNMFYISCDYVKGTHNSNLVLPLGTFVHERVYSSGIVHECY
uniref:Uncharacterized protein n=1 Tax=Anguilla anguilla TaxID=7936 RepID=A0A0E9WRG8_ANGAN